MSERGADQRGELLQAAARVFARDGFHGARVGDIAEEAGVAHGLLYHYFRSKDEVLETIFRSNWQELVREIARSPEVGKRIAEIGGVFSALTRMIDRARDRGEVRAEVEPQLAAFIFYGALEEILTGWVLGHLPSGEDDVRRAVDTVVDVVAAGLQPLR